VLMVRPMTPLFNLPPGFNPRDIEPEPLLVDEDDEPVCEYGVEDGE
jgi:hypothetical protein